jgi:hypothetical protein
MRGAKGGKRKALNHEVLIQVSFWGPFFSSSNFGAPKFRALNSGPDLMERAKLGIQKVHHLLPYLSTYLFIYLPVYFLFFIFLLLFVVMQLIVLPIFLFTRIFFLFLTKKSRKFWIFFIMYIWIILLTIFYWVKFC